VIRFDPVSSHVTAGHGHSRVYDITIAAGSLPFYDLNFISGFNQTGTLHLKFD
jgi:hypothetical protein